MAISKKTMNRQVGVFGFLLICISLTYLVTACAPDKPILLGFVGGLSGRVADLGISGRNGAILAVEQVNSAGGVNGRKVKLVVMDDKQDGDTAKKAVNELIDQGVVAIIGHMTSSMSMQTVPIVNEKKVVMMSPTITTTYLSGKDDYFYRVSNTTKSYATLMAQHLNKLGISKVVAVYDLRNKAYTESWLEDFRKEYEKSGGSIVSSVTFYSGPEAHLYDVVTQAFLSDAEAMVISASAMDTAMICQQTKKIGRSITIAASEWAATEKLLEMGGAAVDGIIVSQFFNRESTEQIYVKFREDYKNRFGNKPGFASVNAYDAANVVLEALKKQKTGKLSKETLRKLDHYDGVQGVVKIDRYGDADRKAFLTVVKNGEFVVIE